MRHRLQIDTDSLDERDQRAGRLGNRVTARVGRASAARPRARDAGVAGRSEVGRHAGTTDDE